MNCAVCGEKSLLFGGSILDGKVCKKCLKKLPTCFVENDAEEDSFFKRLTSEQLKKLIDYQEEKEPELRSRFCKSECYGNVFVDSMNAIVALCNPEEETNGELEEGSAFLIDASHISKVSFSMTDIKANANSVLVLVTVSFEISDLSFPIRNIFVKEDNATVLFSENGVVQYSLPYGAQIIRDEIVRINRESVEDYEYWRSRASSAPSGDELEYVKAAALFMIDDEYTEKDLKKIRNGLIKVFHPDGGEFNEEYAQKIGKAYDVLLNRIKKTI